MRVNRVVLTCIGKAFIACLSARCHDKKSYVYGFKMNRNECSDLNPIQMQNEYFIGIHMYPATAGKM